MKKERTNAPVTNSGVAEHISNHASSVDATRGEDNIITANCYQHYHLNALCTKACHGKEVKSITRIHLSFIKSRACSTHMPQSQFICLGSKR